MSQLDLLNDRQREAVTWTEGPLLILAGAGSGKTRVLTHRIAYLIEEKGVDPWNILAITFTNKAAGEMKTRVINTVREGAAGVWVSTFHSFCVRILRRHAEHLGYGNNFSVYDTDDQKTVMKLVLKKLNVDPKLYKERAMLNYISDAKNHLISPEACIKNVSEFREGKIGLIYKTYQEELKHNNAMDFDDLLVNMVQLLLRVPEILENYQNRFRYIMVDEYQDTNHVQFKLVELLAKKYRNLCVVGDDDQSIYRFRGADIRNILEFEEAFPGAKVVKLEQNYRSTGNILTVANEVIRHNRARKAKTLWTANEEGGLPSYCQFDTGEMEADFIARLFQEKKEKGRDWKDMAVLYRTNAQSRLLEEACVRKNIPYLLVGGVNFYQRKEIKDILCYLKTIANGRDDLAVQRIINVPKRGIGASSIGKIVAWAGEQELSFYQSCVQAASIPGMGKAAGKIQGFVSQIEDFARRNQAWELGMQDEEVLKENGRYGLPGLIRDIVEETGYKKELEAEGEDEAKARLENIDELINKAASYCAESENPNLDGFLEEVSLVADVDRMDDSEERVTLMTLHSAKGLEFPVVYLSGMEDGLFPSSMSIMSEDPTDIEEERRLCYVGITRARERLTMTAAQMRMIKGETRYSRVSRFVEEIPKEMVDIIRPGVRANAYASQTAKFTEKPFGGSKQFKPAAGGGTPGFGKEFTIKKAASLEYGAGDRVRHGRFGEGTVQSVVDGARDFEVAVEFDRFGVKKMFASVAKLEKL